MSSLPTPSSSNNNNWYYSAQGHAEGPVTTQQLSELAAVGAIVTDTLLWRPGMDEWVAASKLQPEVLPNTSLAPAIPPVPAVPIAADAAAPSTTTPAPARKSALKPIPQVAVPPPAESPPPAVEESADSGLFSKLFGRLKKK